jgi:catechol 2,3-dioxygenase-like lactoylglutathione lyase family enzyme
VRRRRRRIDGLVRLYHTGLVVPSLKDAAQRFSAMAGYSWTKPIAGPVTVRTDAGAQTVDMAFVYSLEAPHLELIQEIPGTPWTHDGGAHHLGYFTDDFAATATALTETGYRLELCHTDDGETPSMFAYYLSPDGVRIEIVDQHVFGDFAAFLKAFS